MVLSKKDEEGLRDYQIVEIKLQRLEQAFDGDLPWYLAGFRILTFTSQSL